MVTIVLQNGVTMAKLWPLLSHHKYFMNCLICTMQVVIMLYTEDLLCAILLGLHKSAVIWEN